MSAWRDRSPRCFNGLPYHCGFPQIKIVCQQIRGIPLECFSTRRPASSAALGGSIHKLTNTPSAGSERLTRFSIVCRASRCRRSARDALGRGPRGVWLGVAPAFSKATPPTVRAALTISRPQNCGAVFGRVCNRIDPEPNSPLRAGGYWSVYELTHRAPGSRRSAGPRSTRTECPRICWQTIFICGKPQWYGKPLKQLGFLSRQADIRRVTGPSSVSTGGTKPPCGPGPDGRYITE